MWKQYLLFLVAMLCCVKASCLQYCGHCENKLLVILYGNYYYFFPSLPKIQLHAIYTAWSSLPILDRAASGNVICSLEFSCSSSSEKPSVLGLFTEQKKN